MRGLVSIIESILVTWAMATGVGILAGVFALMLGKIEGAGLFVVCVTTGFPSWLGLLGCATWRRWLNHRENVPGFPVIMKGERQ